MIPMIPASTASTIMGAGNWHWQRDKEAIPRVRLATDHMLVWMAAASPTIAWMGSVATPQVLLAADNKRTSAGNHTSMPTESTMPRVRFAKDDSPTPHRRLLMKHLPGLNQIGADGSGSGEHPLSKVPPMSMQMYLRTPLQ